MSSRILREASQNLQQFKTEMKSAFEDFMKYIHEEDFFDDDRKFHSKLWRCEEYSVTIVSAYEQMHQSIYGYQNVVNPTGQLMPAPAGMPMTGQPLQTALSQPREAKPRIELTPLLVVLVVAAMSIVGFLAYMNYTDAQAQINQLQSVMVNASGSVQQVSVVRGQMESLLFRQDQLMRGMIFLTGMVIAVVSAPKILDTIGYHLRKVTEEKPYPPVREWMQEKFRLIREKYTSSLFLIQLQDQDESNVNEPWAKVYPDPMIYSREAFLLKKLRSEFSTAVGEVYQVAEATIHQRIENVQQGSLEMMRTYAMQKGTGVG